LFASIVVLLVELNCNASLVFRSILDKFIPRNYQIFKEPIINPDIYFHYKHKTFVICLRPCTYLHVSYRPLHHQHQYFCKDLLTNKCEEKQHMPQTNTVLIHVC